MGSADNIILLYVNNNHQEEIKVKKKGVINMRRIYLITRQGFSNPIETFESIQLNMAMALKYLNDEYETKEFDDSQQNMNGHVICYTEKLVEGYNGKMTNVCFHIRPIFVSRPEMFKSDESYHEQLLLEISNNIEEINRLAYRLHIGRDHISVRDYVKALIESDKKEKELE